MPVQISPAEILFVLIIALVVLGPKRLPDAARSVGKGVRELKQSLTGHDDEDDEDLASLRSK